MTLSLSSSTNFSKIKIITTWLIYTSFLTRDFIKRVSRNLFNFIIQKIRAASIPHKPWFVLCFESKVFNFESISLIRSGKNFALCPGRVFLDLVMRCRAVTTPELSTLMVYRIITKNITRSSIHIIFFCPLIFRHSDKRIIGICQITSD